MIGSSLIIKSYATLLNKLTTYQVELTSRNHVDVPLLTQSAPNMNLSDRLIHAHNPSVSLVVLKSHVTDLDYPMKKNNNIIFLHFIVNIMHNIS